MTIKTVLVHVDESAQAQGRVRIAAHIALACNAHLIGASATGISRQFFQHIASDERSPDLQSFSETLRHRANNALDKFEAITLQLGIPSVERRIIEDEASSGLATHARYCDLCVLSQVDPQHVSPNANLRLPEIVVLESGGPALILPHRHADRFSGKRILIGWNGSPAIRKAIHFAIPLLLQAETVEVAVLNSDTHPEIFGDAPGGDIAAYLSRHGISAVIIQRTVTNTVGHALLSLAAEFGSDLIVMGCYGHARLREMVLGGTTRNVFRSMPVPVLMAH